MPFDIFITREASFSDIAKGTASRPITATERSGTFTPAPATLRQDGAWWVRRPDTNEPWFAARDDRGHLVLSCSYSNHRYLANFADAFDQALRIAGQLDARVFEEVRGNEVTAQNVDELLAPKGEYVKLQIETFKRALEHLDRTPGGPLEWPLGPTDVVSEYCVFHLQPEQPFPPTIERVIQGAGPSGRLVVDSARTGLFMGGGAGREVPLTKLLLRPDGKLQIWPAHGRAPFSRTATTAFELAQALRDRWSGTLTFNGRPFEGALADNVAEKVRGLGVEMFEWVAREFGLKTDEQ